MRESTLTSWTVSARRWLGARLGNYLSQSLPTPGTAAATDPAKLMACVRPGDVILVEGNTRLSVAIKYLTQSTWSGDPPRGQNRCAGHRGLGNGLRGVFPGDRQPRRRIGLGFLSEYGREAAVVLRGLARWAV